MRTIALEEHFMSPTFLEGPGRHFKELAVKAGGARAAKTFELLCNLGAKRLAAMDAAGVDVQVVSLAPGVEQLEAAEAIAAATETNEFLAAAIRQNPTRFTGLVTLPIGAPDKAAQEFERRVSRDGFKGAIINGHDRGRYLDDKFYWPVLECAEALDVPIYLHPALPPKAVIEASYGGFSPVVTFLLAGRVGAGILIRRRMSFA